MNTLESCQIANPKNIIDTCSKFIIDETDAPFVLSEITTTGNQYTLSFWVSSETSGEIQVYDEVFTATPTWQQHSITFTATETGLAINFLQAGTYYIYHPKLEIGNKATDWEKAPEDSEVELIEVKDAVASLELTQGQVLVNASDASGSLNTIIGIIDGKGAWESRYVDVNGNVLSGIHFDFTNSQFVFDGKVIAKSGDIGGCIIENGILKVNKVSVQDTVTASYIEALKVKAGSVDAENITGTTITGKVINNGNGTFYVDASGNLTAKNATIGGTVNATSGAIGGWKILSNGLIGSAVKVNGKWYGISLDARANMLSNTGSRVFAIGHLGDGGEGYEEDALNGSWYNAAFSVTAGGHVKMRDVEIGNLSVFDYHGNAVLGGKVEDYYFYIGAGEYAPDGDPFILTVESGGQIIGGITPNGWVQL